MRRILFILVGAVMLAPIPFVGAYFYFLRYIDDPGPLKEPTTVILPRGSGAEAVSVVLSEAGVVGPPLAFMAAAKLSQAAGPLKAGEYAFPAHVSISDVLKMLREGKTVARRLTIPEGTTSHQVAALLRQELALVGDIPDAPEGALLPETYHFSYGDTRASVLDRMRKAMSKALADAWAARAEGLPLQSPEQALILASIIEKETSVAAERPKVAGVFVNRLRAGMKLQSDPTTIYALTQGKSDLGRQLTRADLRMESAYNTYHADGLPPGPITNPGRAAIAAALRPESHNLLYFVADGTGGHAFAATLAEHNKNVQRWRDSRKEP